MFLTLLLVMNIGFGLTRASSEPSHQVPNGSDESSPEKEEITSEDRTGACAEDASIPPRSNWYPEYHLAPPTGWMNDPNGLIEYQGWYHAFYQHNPYDTEPRQIHWGHARSRDMLRWEHLPVALAPDSPEDEGGCWSGSAVDDNGTLTLMYTGNGREGQAQCLATSDDKEGIHFTKHGKVLDPPAGVVDFRDPKMFRVGDSWACVVGLSVNGSGQVRLYESPDLRQWEGRYDALARGEPGGYMWECPDLFPVGQDKHALMFSPQGVRPKGYLYRNLYQNGYLLGTWSPGQQFLVEQPFATLDSGHDFYAPQSFSTVDGRRIVLSWLDMWEEPMPEKEQGWAGMLSLPREITLEGKRLVQNPIREVETLRSNPNGIRIGATTLDSSRLELSSEVRTAEVTITFNTTVSTAEKYGLHLGRPDSASGLFLYVDGQAGRIVLDRRYPQFGLSGTRSIPLATDGATVTLRVFFDHSSVEVFTQGTSLSCRIYPRERALAAYAENGKAQLVESTLWVLTTSREE